MEVGFDREAYAIDLSWRGGVIIAYTMVKMKHHTNTHELVKGVVHCAKLLHLTISAAEYPNTTSDNGKWCWAPLRYLPPPFTSLLTGLPARCPSLPPAAPVSLSLPLSVSLCLPLSLSRARSVAGWSALPRTEVGGLTEARGGARVSAR